MNSSDVLGRNEMLPTCGMTVLCKRLNALEGYLSYCSAESGNMRKGRKCPVVDAVPVLGHPVPLQN